jgi:N-acylneuraminate cytidylyltransferase
MLYNNSTIVLIPARGNSKRLYRKNLREIAGDTLVGHAIAFAKQLNVDDIYISTEDSEIAKLSKNCGASVSFIRPAELSQDDTTDFEVFEHFLTWYKKEHGYYPELIVHVRATSPIRCVEDGIEPIRIMKENLEFDSLRTISLPHQTPYKMWTIDDEHKLDPIMQLATKDFFDKATQSLPVVYAQDGVIDIIRSRTIIELRSMAGKKIYGYIPKNISYDIDTAKDFSEAAPLIRQQTFANRFGIIQGRLTKSSSLQCFPNNNWASEFELALNAGYTYIELIRDKVYNTNNLLWNHSAEQINLLKETKLKYGITTPLICDDYVMQCDWNRISANQYSTLVEMIEVARDIGIQGIVYPLMEQASINDENHDTAICWISKIARLAATANIRIYLESNLEGQRIINMLNVLDSPNISVCFDSGNLFNEGINIKDYILHVSDKIGHVHIKDRKNTKNVPIGMGDVDFNEITECLGMIGYSGRVTFESDRGEDPIATAISNLQYYKDRLK